MRCRRWSPCPKTLADEDWQRATLGWVPYLAELLESWRVVRARVGERRYYVASELAADFAMIFPEAQFEVAPPELPVRSASRDDALRAMVNGWIMHSGPTTSAALSHLVGLASAEIEQSLLRLEASGTVLRGNFTGNATGNDPHNCEWCERRLLARIHHLTVATLRKQSRTDDSGAIHAMAVALAACSSAIAGRRRARIAGGRASVAGFRNPGECVGEVRVSRSREQLRSGGTRSAMPHRRRGMGPVVAASGDAGRRRREPAACSADQCGAHYPVRARRCRLDAAAQC